MKRSMPKILAMHLTTSGINNALQMVKSTSGDFMINIFELNKLYDLKSQRIVSGHCLFELSCGPGCSLVHVHRLFTMILEM